MGKIGVFLTNLGKYNEGYLLGQWVNFSVFVEDVECWLKGITCAVSKYSSISTLNELAEKLAEITAMN